MCTWDREFYPFRITFAFHPYLGATVAPQYSGVSLPHHNGLKKIAPTHYIIRLCSDYGQIAESEDDLRSVAQ
jgi:hypothetical protein